MSEFADAVSGIPRVGAATETKRAGKTTAGLLVQQATYNLSRAIFNFSPPTFELDRAVAHWKSKDAANLDGHVPETFALETRVGAALSLLGYLERAPAGGITSVVAASGTLRVMEPVLSRHLAALRAKPVVFQVAAVDYDAGSGQLVPDYALVARVARRLGLPLVVSTLASANDAYHTAVLAAVISAAPGTGPAVHLYDGVRGTRQAYSAPPLRLAPPAAQLPPAASLLDAFAATNRALGTALAPFEYHGPAEPATVYVTLGAPAVLARASATAGVVHVRLYAPFLAPAFLDAVPASASRIVVVDRTNDLYTDVNAAVRMHYGFRGGPRVFSEALAESGLELGPPAGNGSPADTESPAGNGPPTGPPAETGPTVVVWDSDRAPTAVAAARLAGPLADANVYTKFDNCVAGGAVASELRMRFAGQFWELARADIAVVNCAAVLRAVDVTRQLREGGKLVIAAASEAELDKAVPGQLKLNAMAKRLELYRLDYAQVDSATTELRTATLAAQAAIWLLLGADPDTATSSIVHANSLDTELIAATVNVVVSAVKDRALVPVSADLLQTWTKVELSEKEQAARYATAPVATSFAPAAIAVSGEGEELEATEEASAHNAPAGHGLATGKTDALALKKRLLFKEAFGSIQQLRPEIATKTVVSRVKLNQRVTPDDYDRHIFKLELDISGTGLTYAIGEALGIHAPNRAGDVRAFLDWYGVDPDEVHAIPAPNHPGAQIFRTAYQIARERMDLFGKVPKRFYEGLAQFAADGKEKAALQRLLDPAGAEELKRRTEVEFENYVDVLREFPSAKPSFAQLIDLVAPLKRREYSIASSQKVHPNEVHLLIVVVDWVNSKGEKRYGQCSKFLADLSHGDEVVVSVKPSVMKLPADPATPIIMAGLGTGLAPFKAFLEEKMWQRDQGHTIGEVYLFLGSRHQRQEYLYGELFEAYKAAGVLTHIGAAFSRDQPEKIYIQNRIQQSKPQLAEAFVNKGGNFYLCGPTWPVPDISAALTEIVVEGSAKKGVEVNEATLIEELKEAERYILEVY